MLINKIRSEFEHRGYHSITVNAKGIYIYDKVIDDCIYIISLLDYSDGLEFTKEQYNNILRQLKESFTTKQYREVHFLSIINTKYPDKGKQLCQEEDNHWIIDEYAQRLIIYEDQVGQFLDVKEIVEDCFFEYKDNKDNAGRDTFIGRIKKLSLCNSIVIAINIVIFLIMEITGSTENTEYMVKWGAMYWPNVLEINQYYRLFTHMFLHFGIQHLLNNMIVLGVIGGHLERIVGKGRYVFIYLSSGILAGLASMVYNMVQNTIVVSAGASGAIFGVVGAMVYAVAVNRGRLEDISTKQLGVLVILSLYSGFTSQGVDNMAHIGGFVSGIILAMILYKKPKKDEYMHDSI